MCLVFEVGEDNSCVLCVNWKWVGGMNSMEFGDILVMSFSIKLLINGFIL